MERADGDHAVESRVTWMERYTVTRDEAFGLLAVVSQRSSRTSRGIASTSWRPERWSCRCLGAITAEPQPPSEPVQFPDAGLLEAQP